MPEPSEFSMCCYRELSAACTLYFADSCIQSTCGGFHQGLCVTAKSFQKRNPHRFISALGMCFSVCPGHSEGDLATQGRGKVRASLHRSKGQKCNLKLTHAFCTGSGLISHTASNILTRDGAESMLSIVSILT